MCSLHRKERHNEKCIIPFSGGLDSTYLLKRYENSIALVFDDHSKFHREIELPAIENILEVIDRRRITISMPDGDLLDFGVGKNKIDFGLQAGYKVILQITAMAIAQREGINLVLLGNNNENTSFKDEMYRYIKKVERLYNEIYDTKIRVECPLIKLKGHQVVKLAHDLGIPFQLTQSCCLFKYDEISKQKLIKNCGICHHCKKRLKAFKKAKLKDPLIYHEWTEEEKGLL